MLVDVVCLRIDGEKRSAEDVLNAKPLRGDLKVMHLQGELHALLTFPWLGQTGHATSWPRIGPCVLRRIEGDDLVLVGEELVGMVHAQRLVPQAWWCRLVRNAEGAARAPAAQPHAATLNLA